MIKTEKEKQLAEKYLPCFMKDLAEPFDLKGIGYTIFKETGKSSSCPRTLQVNPEIHSFVIEYALYFDFDIQHLYDLEHVFVYVGKDGEIVDVEASFHGKFLKAMVNERLAFEDKTHPVVYFQPGKHAVMSDPSYFNLFIGLKEVCREQAGEAGFLVAPMFEGRLETSERIDAAVKKYICEHYAFTPTGEYQKMENTSECLMSYEDLDKQIVIRMRKWVDKILKEVEN